MDNFLLTTEERNRFATWLENEVIIDSAITKQLEKLNVMHRIILIRREQIDAMQLVARRLRNTESVTI